MKSKFVLILGGWMLAFCLVLSGVSYGAGIVLKINGNDVLKNNVSYPPGTGFAPNYTGGDPAGKNIEFFPGGAPTDPQSIAGRNASFSYTLLGGPIYQYDNLDINGQGVVIRSWSGTPLTLGSHYGFSSDTGSYTAASGSSPALQYDVISFATDWLAGIPVNAPVFSGGSESNLRLPPYPSTDVRLSLTVNWSYSVGTVPNRIVALGYTVKYWLDTESEPADTDPQRTSNVGSGSFSLPATDPKTSAPFGGGTYHFKARANNSFGSGPWSSPFDWTTLSGGGGGTGTKTYILTREANGLGVNTLAIPYDVFSNPSAATPTLNLLVTYVNSNEGSNIVYSIGWWNAATQKPEGFEIKYATINLNDFSATGTSGLGPLNQTNIEKDRAYQLYVIKNSTFSITGSRN